MKVFISYQNNSNEICKKMAEQLERTGALQCWYAPRNLIGKYADGIVEAVKTSQIFIVLLTKEAMESVGVKGEMEMAFSRVNAHEDLIIVPFKLTNEPLEGGLLYYIKQFHWIDATNQTLDEAIQELASKLLDVNQRTALQREAIKNNFSFKCSSNRNINRYLSFASSNSEEDYRLEMENLALYPFEKRVYDQIFAGQSQMNVLDLSALHPKSALARLNRQEVGKYIGFCYDMTIVDNANETFGNEYVKFYQVDVESKDFEKEIIRVKQENNIDDFDVINLTMTIIDIKNPFSILKTARKHVKKGGYMYVRDIDDRVAFVYPDKNELFSTFFKKIKEDKYSGFRESAIPIYSLLKKLKPEFVSLEETGINTSKMNYEDKERMFISYFTYAQREYERLIKENPDEKKYQENLEWIMENFDDIQSEYCSDELIFNSGFMIYLVKF